MFSRVGANGVPLSSHSLPPPPSSHPHPHPHPQQQQQQQQQQHPHHPHPQQHPQQQHHPQQPPPFHPQQQPQRQMTGPQTPQQQQQLSTPQQHPNGLVAPATYGVPLSSTGVGVGMGVGMGPPPPVAIPQISEAEHRSNFHGYLLDYLIRLGAYETARRLIDEVAGIPLKDGAVSGGGGGGVGAVGGPASSKKEGEDASTTAGKTVKPAAGAASSGEEGAVAEAAAIKGESPTGGTAGVSSPNKDGGAADDSTSTNDPSSSGNSHSTAKTTEDASPPSSVEGGAAPPPTTTTTTNLTATPMVSKRENMKSWEGPKPAILFNGSEGFLYEWWQVFWESHRAAQQRLGPQAAMANSMNEMRHMIMNGAGPYAHQVQHPMQMQMQGEQGGVMQMQRPGMQPLPVYGGQARPLDAQQQSHLLRQQAVMNARKVTGNNTPEGGQIQQPGPYRMPPGPQQPGAPQAGQPTGLTNPILEQQAWRQQQQMMQQRLGQQPGQPMPGGGGPPGGPQQFGGQQQPYGAHPHAQMMQQQQQRNLAQHQQQQAQQQQQQQQAQQRAGQSPQTQQQPGLPRQPGSQAGQSRPTSALGWASPGSAAGANVGPGVPTQGPNGVVYRQASMMGSPHIAHNGLPGQPGAMGEKRAGTRPGSPGMGRPDSPNKRVKLSGAGDGDSIPEWSHAAGSPFSGDNGSQQTAMQNRNHPFNRGPNNMQMYQQPQQPQQQQVGQPSVMRSPVNMGAVGPSPASMNAPTPNGVNGLTRQQSMSDMASPQFRMPGPLTTPTQAHAQGIVPPRPPTADETAMPPPSGFPQSQQMKRPGSQVAGATPAYSAATPAGESVQDSPVAGSMVPSTPKTPQTPAVGLAGKKEGAAGKRGPKKEKMGSAGARGTKRERSSSVASSVAGPGPTPGPINHASPPAPMHILPTMATEPAHAPANTETAIPAEDAAATNMSLDSLANQPAFDKGPFMQSDPTNFATLNGMGTDGSANPGGEEHDFFSMFVDLEGGFATDGLGTNGFESFDANSMMFSNGVNM